MSEKLDARKRVVFTSHFAKRWAERVLGNPNIALAEKDAHLPFLLKKVLDSGDYALAYDGEENKCVKYRLVCSVAGVVLTFEVLDADALVFKTVWNAKSWEKKLLEGGLK
ncbi:hypothetical protein HY992_00325 [Candidatus Micrarchaeota archaeon]|nr:hypothetical protein [Candidatus Micrarchaeota archaeon]